MTEPTIGRIVHYRSTDDDFEPDKRFAAIIANINDDGTLNLGVFNIYGVAESEQNVEMVPEGWLPKPGQCEWPPRNESHLASISPITDDEIEEELLKDVMVSAATDPGLKDSTAEEDIEEGMAAATEKIKAKKKAAKK